MWTHEPAAYDCPFCVVVTGGEGRWNRQSDVVWRDEATMAFVSPKWWTRNEGHAIVVPNRHVENLYAATPADLAAVSGTVQRVAIAMRASYDCEGTSTRQHNEPGGNQDVWHLHVHVFPRFAGDRLYAGDDEQRWTEPDERAPYAERLRAALV